MADRPWRHIPLARKISLFFGVAVLLTIAATLLFPWMQMTALNEQSLLWRARRIAAVVRDGRAEQQLEHDEHEEEQGRPLNEARIPAALHKRLENCFFLD